MMVSCATVLARCSPAVRESENMGLKEKINLLKSAAAFADVIMHSCFFS
jgi:hypothetical protein